MEQNQPLKKRIIEVPSSHQPERTLVQSSTPIYQQQLYYNYEQPVSTMKLQHHQQQQPQVHHQHHHQSQQQHNTQHYSQQQTRTKGFEDSKLRNLLQPVQPAPQIVRYEYIDRPMTLNAWTQTRADDFPNIPDPKVQSNEAALLAKIRELEKCLKVQAEFIEQLKDDNLRTPSPEQAVPNSTTITPISVKQEGMRYRILAQADEATSEAQIEIELSSEAQSSNLDCSTDSDRLEICLSDESKSSADGTASRSSIEEMPFNPERPDLENATVSIGPNGTKIPVSAYEKMSWKSPSLATRKLLTLIFDRETLATHSMTGKASPAFKDIEKPIKGRLDPLAVEDIIFIVSKKCGVSHKEVRSAITTKCADENKMIRLQTLKRMAVLSQKRAALRDLNQMGYLNQQNR